MVTSTRLTVREKFAYGLGDCGANLIFQTQVAFLLFYYTDVVGLAAGAAGKILLASRILDAFNAPIVGVLADRTRSRWGRFRPWILWTAVPLALSFVLCYSIPDLSGSGRIVWAVVTYNLLMILYAANNIPYCALGGVMTDDSLERTGLATWRFTCAMAAAFVVNVFTLDLIRHIGGNDAALGYQRTMVLWAAGAVLCFLVTFAFTSEPINPTHREPSTLRQDLADLLGNRAWRCLFVLAVLIYVQLTLRSALMLYYFTHYLHQERLFGRFNGVGLAVTMVGVLLARPLAVRFGKLRTFRACLVLSALSMAAFVLVPADGLWSLFALQMLLQLAFGPTIPLLWTLMADAVDYGERMTGRRSTALAFASIVFGLKLGGGIGGWLGAQWLQALGYSAASTVSGLLSKGIISLISLIPAALLLAGIVAMWFYPADSKPGNEIKFGDTSTPID